MLSTWTIPTDPGYNTRRPNSAQRYEPHLGGERPKPRVKPEAISNAIKGQGSLAMLFNPIARPYNILSRPGSAQPKDFSKENAYHIKQIQKANRKKQQEATVGEPVKAVYKPDKFEHVESKVAQELKAPPPPPRSNSALFLRAHSRNGPSVKNRPSSTEPVIPREHKLTVPKAAAAIAIAKEGSPPKKNRNHIAQNIRQLASSPVPKRAPSAMAIDVLKQKRKDEEEHYKKGTIPKYLKARQKQWKKEEEIRIANIPDPSVPSGHVLMARDERLQTLEALRKNEEELLVELRSLPVRADTLRVRTRKAELERKLTEIESAVKIFSRPKVFVKVDE